MIQDQDKTTRPYCWKLTCKGQRDRFLVLLAHWLKTRALSKFSRLLQDLLDGGELFEGDFYVFDYFVGQEIGVGEVGEDFKAFVAQPERRYRGWFYPSLPHRSKFVRNRLPLFADSLYIDF